MKQPDAQFLAGNRWKIERQHEDDRIMPAHKLVDAPKAPQPPGPFSHANRANAPDDRVNLEAILAAAGCTLQHVVKATLYLTDMADYPRSQYLRS
jgi:Endoribonuclease L-PSP